MGRKEAERKRETESSLDDSEFSGEQVKEFRFAVMPQLRESVRKEGDGEG